MKFTVTIETDSLSEFRWLTERMEFHEATDGGGKIATASLPGDDPTFDQPAEKQPEAAAAAAPEPSKKKLGRPPKSPTPAMVTVAPATGGNGATPEASPAMQQFTDALQATDPKLAPDKLPDLEVLRDAVTTAVRKAQRGEGDTAIMNLLPAFKDRTGLAFVMNATEEHRLALYELVREAGITLA